MKKVLVKEWVVLPEGGKSNDAVVYRFDMVSERYAIDGMKVTKEVFFHFLQIASVAGRVLSITERLQVGLSF